MLINPINWSYLRVIHSNHSSEFDVLFFLSVKSDDNSIKNIFEKICLFIIYNK
jgi:hypothetical protein